MEKVLFKDSDWKEEYGPLNYESKLLQGGTKFEA
jgi:hypothetical protein